jgi:enoyl-CoA hydratase/carnithine racemase
MARDGRIKSETLDGVGLLTVCGHDAKNAITPEMWTSLREALAHLEQDDGVKVVVLTGGGHEAFATDPREEDPAYETYGQGRDGEDDADPGRAGWQALAHFPKPVVARVRGECVGAGLVLALAADIRIAAADSAFAISAARAASLGAEGRLVEAVGAAEARFLLLTGERIEAPEAVRIGLVSRVVPDAELSDTVADLVRQLEDQDPETLSRAKRAIARLAASGEAAGGECRAGDHQDRGEEQPGRGLGAAGGDEQQGGEQRRAVRERAE